MAAFCFGSVRAARKSRSNSSFARSPLVVTAVGQPGSEYWSRARLTTATLPVERRTFGPR